MERQEKAICTHCGHIQPITAYGSINTRLNPELKDKLRTGELFTWTCPDCGSINLTKYPMLYHDPDEKLMFVLSDTPIGAENLPEGYTGRMVGSVGELVEKIKIFDAGLDDIVIEMCKHVTSKELGRDVELKFFQMNGADSEMTFTYPEAGKMEMLAVGFNVYEDCAGILRRNPHILEEAHGLVSIGRSWLRKFFE